MLLPQIVTPCSAFQNDLTLGWKNEKIAFGISTGFRISSQPVYIRLQALQDGNITLFEAIPQSFQDHVNAINVSVLAVLVSSNAIGIRIYKDDVGNLWLAVNYTVSRGQYIDTLTWITSETLREDNLTIPESLPFPDAYPDDVKPFLIAGRKIPVDNTTIKELAESYATQDIIKTVQNILNFVNGTQTYDLNKVQLLMTGGLNTTDILDFINDPLTSLQTNNSFCFERALLAVTMLRAVGVPARTFTNSDLKTWIQVWLPQIGWVDAEVLCLQPTSSLFPRPLSFVAPRMVENFSDAMFPFMWVPDTLMRVANLTLSSYEFFNINDYGTVLSQPVDEELYEASSDDFSFPLTFEPSVVRAAFAWNGSEIVFHLKSEEKSMNKTLTLGETNNIEFGNFGLSFNPIRQGNIIILRNFSFYELPKFDLGFLILTVGVIVFILLFWTYQKRKKLRKLQFLGSLNL